MDFTRLLLIRHGETDWNVQRRVQGHTDIPLNAYGEQQARWLSEALADEGIDCVYSSDLQRAAHTARTVAEPHQAPVILTPGLRERCFGNLEGHTFSDLQAKDPELARLWSKRDPVWQPPGGGESLTMVRERVVSAVLHLAAQHPGQHIAVVAHGGVLDMLYRAATGLDLLAARTWELPNCAINRVLYTDSGLSLVGWGDTSHLEGRALGDGGIA